MFIWKIERAMQELQRQQPEMYAQFMQIKEGCRHRKL